MNQVISPTVGRKVWYRPAKADALGPVPMSFAFGKPLDATIVAVHGDRMVNVQILDGNGRAFTKTSVTLKQDGDEMYKDQDGAEVGGYVEWPSFPKPAEVSKSLASSGAELEAEIQAKGLTAARVTPGDVEANIRSEFYFTAADGVHGASDMGTSPASWTNLSLLTFCVLVLNNHYTVTGQSACASAENFDAEIGRKLARADAVRQIWPLMGYELRSKLVAG